MTDLRRQLLIRYPFIHGPTMDDIITAVSSEVQPHPTQQAGAEEAWVQTRAALKGIVPLECEHEVDEILNDLLAALRGAS